MKEAGLNVNVSNLVMTSFITKSMQTLSITYLPFTLKVFKEDFVLKPDFQVEIYSMQNRHTSRGKCKKYKEVQRGQSV